MLAWVPQPPNPRFHSESDTTRATGPAAETAGNGRPANPTVTVRADEPPPPWTMPAYQTQVSDVLEK